jgi:peroxiredoxin
MIELGQLEKEHAEFDERKVSVVVVSIEKLDDAKETQKEFPHLVVVSDADRKLADAVAAIHKQSAPDGGDTSAPTTLLIDGSGTVRWTFRPERVARRLSPAEVLAAVDEHLVQK